MEIGIYDLQLTPERIPVLVQTGRVSVPDHMALAYPGAVVAFMNKHLHLDRMAEEYVYMIAVSSAMEPIGIFPISHGIADASLVCPREILVRLLLAGGTGMLLIHNHPSGSVAASREDIAAFRKLVKASDMMKVKCLDFIIIGDGYTSFKKDVFFEA